MSKELQTKYGPFGWSIYYEGGGQVPDTLSGLYTSEELALYAIKGYKKPAPKKRVANADSKDKRRA